MRLTAAKAAALLIISFSSGCFSVDPNYGRDEVSSLVASHVGDSHADLAKTAHAEELLARSPLTLDDASVAALALNAETRIAWADLEMAQADLMRATTPQNPIFEGEFQFRGGGIGEGTVLTLVENIISVFKARSAKKGAELAFVSEQCKAANKILGTLFAVKRNYGKLYFAQKAEAIAAKQVEAARSVTAISREQRRSGGASELDVANSNLQAIQAEDMNWQSRIKSEEAELNLSEAIGVAELPEPLKLSSSLPAFEAPLPDEKRLINSALQSRLDLLAGRRDIEALGEKLGVAETYALVPRLDIGPQVQGFAHSSTRAGMKVVFEIPIFNQASAEKRAAGAELKKAQAEYSRSLTDLASRIKMNRKRLIAARNALSHLRKELLPNARAVLHQTQLLYNGMSVGIFQLVEAKHAELSAEQRLLESEAAAWDAEVSLEESLGTVLSKVP